MKGEPLTQKELRSLSDGARVYIESEDEKYRTYNGVAFIEQFDGGCYVTPRSKSSSFSMDCDYADFENDDACIDYRDGSLKIFHWVKKQKGVPA